MVDGRRHRHLVGRQPLRVVERLPARTGRQQVGGLAQRGEGRVGGEVPGVDGLAGEEQGLVAREGLAGVEAGVFRTDAVGGPGRGLGRVLGVDRLVDQRVEGVSGEGEGGAGAFQEGVGEGRSGGGGDEGVLQQVVELVAAVASAEEDAEGLEGLDRQDVAAGEFGRLLREVGGDPAGPLDVHRVTGVVGRVLALDARVGGAVDVVGGGGQRREAAGDQGGGEALGCAGEVPDRAEAAEALAQYGPGRAARESGSDRLGVAHDGVGAEVREVFGLLGGGAAQGQRLPVQRGGQAGAALVQQQHPVVLEGALQPGLPADEAAGAAARSALQVQQPGQGLRVLAGGDHLSPVQLDPLPVRARVVQGDGEPVVGEDRAGLAVAVDDGHGRPPGIRGTEFRAPAG